MPNIGDIGAIGFIALTALELLLPPGRTRASASPRDPVPAPPASRWRSSSSSLQKPGDARSTHHQVALVRAGAELGALTTPAAARHLGVHLIPGSYSANGT